MTSRVSSKNKEKKPKGKIVFKKRDQTGNKKKTVQRNRKQKTASPVVEPGLSVRAGNSLTTAPQ